MSLEVILVNFNEIISMMTMIIITNNDNMFHFELAGCKFSLAITCRNKRGKNNIRIIAIVWELKKNYRVFLEVLDRIIGGF